MLCVADKWRTALRANYMNFKLISTEFEIESQLAKEDCTHENTDLDDNNVKFCMDCGAELPTPEKDYEIETD